ncbi:fungal-specific transcription factor domain-domain-containing protein [Naematelia encephala]|uniref:Fungal-specific transcription factor domain-domain-containing protein n=1 Tax=Naematelia encephala TaxID=71784 RepID=A0A1Y2AYS0_9TREE|nr:fungal-specific transcription factor domain-domain-containing protein [Naematelia encephala]
MASRPAKNGRPQVACAECRRSKLKCNRAWPCSECTRKGCASICPSGITKPRPSAPRLSEELRPHQEMRYSSISRPSVSPARIGSNEDVYRNSRDFLLSTPDPGLLVSPEIATPTVQAILDYSLDVPQAGPNPNPFDIPSVGQLSLASGGRSRFYGPTAAAHVLPDEEHMEDAADEETEPEMISIRDSLPFPFSAHCTTSKRAVIAEARKHLPTRDLLGRWCDVYWRASSWRFEPISRDYLDGIVLEVYGSMDGQGASRKASQLAVLFAVLAIGCLFDDNLAAHSEQARRFDNLALTCLNADDFLTNISVTSLTCLHLHCCYLLNDDHPRTGEIYALVGLALRLATIAGFHRDGIWWQLPPREADARRRVWWEILTLERINSNRFGCPPFIRPDQFDTLRPSDQNIDSFLYWRWEWDNILHDMIDKLDAMRKLGSLDTLPDIDKSVRKFLDQLPEHLRPSVSDLATSAGEHVCKANCLQRIRIALHYNTGLLQLHRLAFSRALKSHQEEPLSSEYRSSVHAVVSEACPNILSLVQALYSHGPVNTRHMVVALDLFSGLVPVAALVIYSPKSRLANDCHHQLLRGIQLLEMAYEATPCRWYRILLQRGQKLGYRATLRLASRWVTNVGANNPPDVDAMLGNVTRLHETAPTAAPTPFLREEDGMGEDTDFDRWLAIWTTDLDSVDSQHAGPLLSNDMDALLFGTTFLPSIAL